MDITGASIRKKSIREALKAQLDGPLTIEEIKESIKNLALNKTPGLDGLPNEFYKEYIDLLSQYLLLFGKSPSVMELFLRFYRSPPPPPSPLRFSLQVVSK